MLQEPAIKETISNFILYNNNMLDLYVPGAIYIPNLGSYYDLKEAVTLLLFT